MDPLVPSGVNFTTYPGGIGALSQLTELNPFQYPTAKGVSMYDVEATLTETSPTVLKLTADCTRNEAVQVKPHTSNQPGPNQTGMRDIC
jgi:hypothetical protein